MLIVKTGTRRLVLEITLYPDVSICLYMCVGGSPKAINNYLHEINWSNKLYFLYTAPSIDIADSHAHSNEVQLEFNIKEG